MKVERKRQQLMGLEAPLTHFCFCTRGHDKGPHHDNRLNVRSLKVKGCHLTQPSVLVHWPRSLGKKSWWEGSLSTGITNWAFPCESFSVRPYAPTFPQSKNLEHKARPYLATDSLAWVLDPSGFSQGGQKEPHAHGAPDKGSKVLL